MAAAVEGCEGKPHLLATSSSGSHRYSSRCYTLLVLDNVTATHSRDSRLGQEVTVIDMIRRKAR